jgi:predicted nucleotidyltransferase
MVGKTTDIKTSIIALYRSNYLAQYHVRELAKLTKKSHVTLLPHLKALEKDKILVSKTTGKNKVYSLNFDNIITRNYLIISETVEAMLFLEYSFLIKKINSEIFDLKLPGTMILFGSYAKRTFRKESDIDFFYVGSMSDKETEEIRKIGKTYGKTINIKTSIPTNFESGLKKKDPLIIEVVKNHILLHNSELFINSLWRHYDGIR